MNYIVTAGKVIVRGHTFKTAYEAHEFARVQKQQWTDAGMYAPEYHVYYQGLQCVEVDENGTALSEK